MYIEKVAKDALNKLYELKYGHSYNIQLVPVM